MKKFINLGRQLSFPDKNGPERFTFFCTYDGLFEKFDDEWGWETASEFRSAFFAEGGGEEEFQMYLKLIPNKFKEDF